MPRRAVTPARRCARLRRACRGRQAGHLCGPAPGPGGVRRPSLGGGPSPLGGPRCGGGSAAAGLRGGPAAPPLCRVRCGSGSVRLRAPAAVRRGPCSLRPAPCAFAAPPGAPRRPARCGGPLRPAPPGLPSLLPRPGAGAAGRACARLWRLSPPAAPGLVGLGASGPRRGLWRPLRAEWVKRAYWLPSGVRQPCRGASAALRNRLNHTHGAALRRCTPGRWPGLYGSRCAPPSP